MLPKIVLILKTVIFSLLTSLIIKKLTLKTSNYFMVLIFTIIALLNGYLIYLLVTSVNINLFDTFDRVLTVFASISMILMCVCSANYNFNRFHLRSTLFLLATYCFAFADITAFSGYFLDYKSLFYVERFFAISGFLCFLNYVMLENKKRVQESIEKSVHYY